MCGSSPPPKVADKLASAPAAALDPPEPVEIGDDEGFVKSKRKGRKSLRIDLAAGNTSLTPVTPNIPN